jgi:hypothetical protein
LAVGVNTTGPIRHDRLLVTLSSDLPEALRKAIRAGKVPEGRKADDRDMGGYRKFIVAGISKTSALVGYETGDYAPNSHALAYVIDGSQWVPVKEWGEGINGFQTLNQLIYITDYLTKNPYPLGDQ